MPGAHGIQHAPQAEQVGAVVGRLALRLLGRHVLRRSRHHAALRLAGIVDGPSQPKVGDLDPFDAVLQQDIRRLDVAMDQSLGMRRGQPQRGLHADAKDFLVAQRAIVVDSILKRAAGDTGHHQVRETASGVGVDRVDGYDVVVNDRRGGLGLAKEPPSGGAAGGHLRGQHLNRHDPVQRRVERFEDDAHAAFTENADDLIWPETAQVSGVIRRRQEVKTIAAARRFGPPPGSALPIVGRGPCQRRIRLAAKVPQVIPDPAAGGEAFERLLAGAAVIKVASKFGLLARAQLVVQVKPQPVRIALVLVQPVHHLHAPAWRVESGEKRPIFTRQQPRDRFLGGAGPRPGSCTDRRCRPTGPGPEPLHRRTGRPRRFSRRPARPSR